MNSELTTILDQLNSTLNQNDDLIATKFTAVAESLQRLIDHRNNLENPHGVTASQTGAHSKQEILEILENYYTGSETEEAISTYVANRLGAVRNYRIATQEEAEIGESNNTYMTPLRSAQQNQAMIDAMSQSFDAAATDLENNS